jgi:benzoyl-CoA reductase/2-hydroxyglutaryl-CoA dehydratase subunit BcrC/BadD/HgdB
MNAKRGFKMNSENKKKKRTSAKTLKTAREAGYFGKKILKNAQNAEKEGRPIAWSMVNYNEGELIAKAMGMELVFPENYGAFSAAVRKAEPYLERSSADGFPETLCGYSRISIGYASMLADNDMQPPEGAPGGGLPKPTLLMGSGVVCDARYKWFQSLKRYLDVPVWVLELPMTGTKEFYLPGNKESTIKFMMKALREFVTFLEKLLGKKMDWDRLCELVDQTYKTLRLAYEVDLLRKAVPSPMVSQDFWAVMIPFLYLPDDPESYEFYQKVYDEVKHRVDNKIGAIPNEKYRMMFAELPPWHTLAFFDDLAEKFGIAMVMESWGYHAQIPVPQEEIEGVTDPLELIARLCYRKFTEYVDVSQQYGVDPSFFAAPFFQYAPDYRADGLMCHILRSCRAATYTLLHTRNALMDIHKVPSLVIDGDIVDLRVFNEEEAFSKAEAFVEIMDHYRNERKKAGLPW